MDLLAFFVLSVGHSGTERSRVRLPTGAPTLEQKSLLGVYAYKLVFCRLLS